MDLVGDHGANVAAEIGFALANVLARPVDTAWRPFTLTAAFLSSR
ncbi:hypothetical protein CCP3SC15_3140002 [Gammaproteobacteria bacterium]